MARVLRVTSFACIVSTLYLVLRTAMQKAYVENPKITPVENNFPTSIVEGLSEAIRFATISYDHSFAEQQLNHSAFQGLQNYIFKRYPAIFSQPPDWVSHEVIANHSILVQVHGQDPTLKPYMLCAHLDVVPVDEKLWTHPPFDGYTDDTFVWGRGALDDKHNLMAILEALSLRVLRADRPKRGFFLALGHDEEIHGLSGAKTIAKHLQSRNVQLEFIMDEGTMILQNAIPGVQRPIALIGVAEKGYLTVKVECKHVAKHASIPERETAITTLAKALVRFSNDAHPAQMTRAQEALLRQAAPYASLPYNVVYSNVWLFKPLLTFVMARMNTISSQMRTTSAITIVRGGSKENVVPNRAEAFVNHRILPGYTVNDVVEFDRQLVKDIPEISVTIHKRSFHEPVLSPPAVEDSFGYKQIKNTTMEIYPDAIVAASIMVANTDTRHYFEANLTQNIFRYSPILLTLADVLTIHGNNERISKLNFRRLANFYFQLFHNCDQGLSKKMEFDHFEL